MPDFKDIRFYDLDFFEKLEILKKHYNIKTNTKLLEKMVDDDLRRNWFKFEEENKN